MESLNSTLARNNENGVQRSQWKQLLAELFCMVSKKMAVLCIGITDELPM
jgi:hypothetical protein